MNIHLVALSPSLTDTNFDVLPARPMNISVDGVSGYMSPGTQLDFPQCTNIITPTTTVSGYSVATVLISPTTTVVNDHNPWDSFSNGLELSLGIFAFVFLISLVRIIRKPGGDFAGS